MVIINLCFFYHTCFIIGISISTDSRRYELMYGSNNVFKTCVFFQTYVQRGDLKYNRQKVCKKPYIYNLNFSS
ncbi:hypothetical protein KC19_9G179000 [Ceratodon purpureus]|uniref:Secreted protein n=1 Tax=Ceratodon purpureus TaxID=3225 RepID=A0A8T0GX80_CERPU|nr:hypothetical protein KC19_9G179000 [Ceratodon purpureus]